MNSVGMRSEDYVAEHGEALERAISAAVQRAIVSRAADPLLYVGRELIAAAGPTSNKREVRHGRVISFCVRPQVSGGLDLHGKPPRPDLCFSE